MTGPTQQTSNGIHADGNIPYNIDQVNGKPFVLFFKEFMIDQIDILQNQINILIEHQMFWRKLISTPIGGGFPANGDDGDYGAGPSGHAWEKDAQSDVNEDVAAGKDDQTDAAADKDFEDVVKDASEAAVDEAVDDATKVDAGEEEPIKEDIFDEETSSDNDDVIKTAPTRDIVSPETAAIIDEIYGVGNWWCRFKTGGVS